MALPPLTPEQRAAALEKAAKARKERAEVKNRLKHGGVSLSEVLTDGQTDDVIGKMKVSALLESLPNTVVLGCFRWWGEAPDVDAMS
ncbi:integration host factor, actinobacterial type, partial [Streptomonospora salina]|uniref:integration host factor, actinobacterial type n=1 Tax=Streptomonospora salina TaxID=104205 RepID=UPI0031E85D46